MSAAEPLPEPEFRRDWRDWRDCDLDSISLLVSAHLEDEKAARWLLQSMDRSQLIEMLWTVSQWFDWAAGRALDDPLGHLQAVARSINEWPEDLV